MPFEREIYKKSRKKMT